MVLNFLKNLPPKIEVVGKNGNFWLLTIFSTKNSSSSENQFFDFWAFFLLNFLNLTKKHPLISET